MALAIALTALFLASLALPLAIYSALIVKAQQLSTHRIEYMQPPSPFETAQNIQELSRISGGDGRAATQDNLGFGPDYDDIVEDNVGTFEDI